jgi:hypothetical protein
MIHRPIVYALFVYIMMSMHTRTTMPMCVCLLLNCTLFRLLPTAVHDSAVYRYSTHWLIRLHFDNNYTQNHHPVPFLCPWPVPDCGGHQIRCQANFTVLVCIAISLSFTISIYKIYLHFYVFYRGRYVIVKPSSVQSRTSCKRNVSSQRRSGNIMRTISLEWGLRCWRREQGRNWYVSWFIWELSHSITLYWPHNNLSVKTSFGTLNAKHPQGEKTCSGR